MQQAHSGERTRLWPHSLCNRYELRLAIPEGKQVSLYPDKEEPKHILNIKRGIISALLVPPETEEDKQVVFLVRIQKVDNTGALNSPSRIWAGSHCVYEVDYWLSYMASYTQELWTGVKCQYPRLSLSPELTDGASGAGQPNFKAVFEQSWPP